MAALRNLVLTLAAALALAGGPALAARDDMALGDPNAKVTVVEYASLSCSHCAAFHNEVFPAFKKRYVDTGKVRFVYREFLTAPVSLAAAGALTARCAGPRRYFAVIEAFFHGQADAYGPGGPRALLLRAGKAGGLTEKQIDRCLGDEKAQAALQARVARYADGDGIDATPTFVINGKRLVGEHDLEALAAVIDPLLAR